MSAKRDTTLPASARELADQAAAKFSQRDDSVTFAAYEHAGLVVVIARRTAADDLRSFVSERGGTVQRHAPARESA